MLLRYLVYPLRPALVPGFFCTKQSDEKCCSHYANPAHTWLHRIAVPGVKSPPRSPRKSLHAQTQPEIRRYHLADRSTRATATGADPGTACLDIQPAQSSG